MLRTGHPIEVGSSLTATKASTMLCLWSDQVKQLGQSKTVGDLLGEKADIFALPKETPVLFAKDQLLPFDRMSSS